MASNSHGVDSKEEMARALLAGMFGSRAWGVAMVYLGISVVFCWPLLANPLANGAGDWDQHIFYYASVLRNAAFGDLPFWNPWYCGGNVLWANPQISLISPVYLLAFVMPLTLAVKANVVIHYLIGCIGMHLFVRRTAGVTAFAPTVFLVSLFVFSGSIAIHLGAGHTNFLPVLLLPLLAYGFWRAVEGRPRDLVFAAAVLGVCVLDGGLHVLPLAAVLLGSFGMAAFVFRRTIRPAVAAGAILLLGCAFAAPKLVPAVAFVRSPHFRDTRPTKQPDFMSARMLLVSFWSPWQRSITGKVTPDVQWYGWQEYGNYLGLSGASLAVGSLAWIILFRRRAHWRELATALALVVAVLLTAGEFAQYAPAQLLRTVPMLSSFRIPSRYTFVVALTAAMCITFAVRAGQDRIRRVGWRWLVGVLCLAGVVEIVLVNRQHFEGAFVLPAETQSRLFERVTPIVAARQLVTPGPPVHRTFMLDSMLTGRSTLDCYEPLQVRSVAQPGAVAIEGDGEVALTDQAFRPNRIAAWVAVGDEPVRLVVNQNFSLGWTSNVGPVLRHPRTRRPSVRLPAGYEGPVVFRFVPPGLYAGIALLAAAIALSIGICRKPPGGST